MGTAIGARVLVVGSTGAGKEAERWLASVPDRREGARD